MSQTITERLLNKKRHTVGYVVGGVEQSRAATIRLAKKGEIEGVRVCNGPVGPYLSSTTIGDSLYGLPARVVAGRIARAAAASATRRAATVSTARVSRVAAKTARKGSTARA